MAKTRTFTFPLDDDRELVAPYFEDAMDAGFLRTHRKDSEVEQMFALVEKALDADALAIFDTLPLSKMNAFFTAWQKDAGVTAGE